MSNIEINAEDLQAVIMELQAENSNLRLMKSALSRKIKEQADEIAEWSQKYLDDLQSKLPEPEGIDGIIAKSKKATKAG
jgi:regulator of replication initiation timing